MRRFTPRVLQFIREFLEVPPTECVRSIMAGREGGWGVPPPSIFSEDTSGPRSDGVDTRRGRGVVDGGEQQQAKPAVTRSQVLFSPGFDCRFTSRSLPARHFLGFGRTTAAVAA